MSPSLRKFALTLHVITSVGWLGAVATFLALAVVSLSTQDTQLVRALYLAMELIGRFILVPLSIASLITGVIQSLGTKWGLFRHYWVVAKLIINVFATGILLLYKQTLSHLATIAAETTFSTNDLAVLQSPSALLHAGAALLVLLTATILSIYKPQGITRYGWRRQQEERKSIAEKRVRIS